MRTFIVLVIAMAAYGWFLAQRFSAEPSWADASGYLNSATLLKKGQLTCELRTPDGISNPYPYHFEPLGFHFNEDSKRLTSTYFVGLPLHLALASFVVGMHYSPYVIIIGSALLTLLVTFLIASELGLGPLLAATAATSMAICPVFVFTSTTTLSDTVATFWCSFAFFAGLKARSGRLGWALLAGCSLGVAILVRSTNVLMIVAIVMLLGNRKAFLAAAVGGLPAIGFLLTYQVLVYGNPLRSGYGNFAPMFSTHIFLPTEWFIARYFMLLMPFALLAPSSCVGLFTSGFKREMVALLTWAAVFLLFYGFYSPVQTHWSNLRFIEPAFPAIVVLSGLGVAALASSFVSKQKVAFAGSLTALMVFVAGFVTVGLYSHYPNHKEYDRGFVESGIWISHNLPKSTVVVSMLYTGMIYHRSDEPILRWDLVSKRDAEGYLNEMKKSSEPVFALLDTSEVRDPRIKNIPGKWMRLVSFESSSLWRVTPN